MVSPVYTYKATLEPIEYGLVTTKIAGKVSDIYFENGDTVPIAVNSLTIFGLWRKRILPDLDKQAFLINRKSAFLKEIHDLNCSVHGYFGKQLTSLGCDTIAELG
jgi:hypothetical protein